jgi:hypothetical protein
VLCYAVERVIPVEPAPDCGARMTGMRRAAALVLPWVLLPAALYVALLPLAHTTVPLRRMMLIGVAGGLAVGLPGLALRYIETRAGSGVAVRLMVLLLAAAVLLLAVASGVGAWAPLAVALMQASAYGYGRRLGGILRFDDEEHASWQGVPIRIAVGWTVLLLAFVAVGLAGLLTRPVVGLVYIAGVVLAVSRVHGTAGHAPGPSTVWWWGLGVLLLIGFVGALAPEVRHDALAAHLPLAREFASRHAIVEMRQNMASYFQINADVLYATAMVWVPDERVPKLMHFAAGVAACAVIYDLGARLWNRSAGLVAAAVLAGTPLIWWLAGSAYVDLWTALFGAAAVTAVLLYQRRPGPASAGVLGLLAGAAVGVKVPAVALIVPLMGVLLLRARTTGRWWGTVAALGAGAALTGVFPYARAWVLTGNPMFPFLQSLFGPGGGFLDAQVFRRLAGQDASLGDLLLLPWRVTRFPERFVEDGSLGVAYLALLPLALAAMIRGIPRWITATVIVSVLIWFRTSQYLRFLVPMLPLLALVGGAGVTGTQGVRGAAPAAVAVAVLSLALNAGAWASPGPPNFPYGVAAGRVTRSDYSAVHVPGFRVSEFARRRLPPDARIISAGDDRVFRYEQFVLPLSWYGRLFGANLLPVVATAPSGRDLARTLSAAGFTHLVVDRHSSLLAGARSTEAWVAREAFWEDDLWLEYAADEHYLFALADPRGPRARGPVLRERTMPLDPGARESFEAPVVAGALYAVDALARAAGPDARFEMTVAWLDGGGGVVGRPVSRAGAPGEERQRFAIAGAAPSGARRALVTLSEAGAGAVEIRPVVLYELR